VRRRRGGREGVIVGRERVVEGGGEASDVVGGVSGLGVVQK